MIKTRATTVSGSPNARRAASSSNTRPPSATHKSWVIGAPRSEEHTSELQSRPHLVCRLLLDKKKTISFISKAIKCTLHLSDQYPELQLSNNSPLIDTCSHLYKNR